VEAQKKRMREKIELEKVKNNPKQCKLNFNLTIVKPHHVSDSPTTDLITSESSSKSLPCTETEPSSKLLPDTATLDFNLKSNSTSNTESSILTASTTSVSISNSSSTNSVLQDISPEKIIKLKFTESSTQLITPGNMNQLSSPTKVRTLDNNQQEPNNDKNSSLSADSLFIALSNTNTVQYKLAFLRNHPIQPSTNTHKLPFDAFRVYNRQFHHFNHDITEIETINRHWISYNLASQHFYCCICMAFSTDQSSAWVKGVNCRNKNLYEKISKHENSKIHDISVQSYIQASSKTGIQDLLNTERRTNVARNREVVKRIIDVILFLAKQSLAFRGKRNESALNFNMEHLKDLDNGTGINMNRGNFIELVRLLSKYDPVLQNHLVSAEQKSQKQKLENNFKTGRGSRITFLSKNTVNKLLLLMSLKVKKTILTQLSSVKHFSLEIDSTQDVAVINHLCICLRYVFNGRAEERVLALIPLESGTGVHQFTKIKEVLVNNNIDIQHLISISFDGAANMSGHYNGVRAFIQEELPQTIYTHCHAHALNLVISDASKCCIQVQDLFTLLKNTTAFISRSYKRTNLWKGLLSTKIGSERLRKLQKVEDTRWNSKDAALQAIFHGCYEDHNKRDRFAILIEVLHTLGYDTSTDSDTRSEARDLLVKWCSFETIMTVWIFLNIFCITTPISKYLQSKGLNYLSAWNQIVSFKKELKNISTDEYFQNIFTEVKKFVNIMVTKTNHLEHVVIEEDFKVKRKRKIKMMPGEKSRDERSNFDSKNIYRIEVISKCYGYNFDGHRFKIYREKKPKHFNRSFSDLSRTYLF